LADISSLQSHQIPGAIEVLYRAFLNDPMMCYIFPDPHERNRLLRRICRAPIRYSLLYGEAYGTGDKTEGVACWLKPGQTRPTLWRLFRAGMLFLPFLIGRDAWLRFNRVLVSSERIHMQAMLEPHWHLWSLGVAPSSQNRGVGRALLQPVLTKADLNRQACYLDTFVEANCQFYKRVGFYLAQHGKVEPDGPAIWGLVREAGHCNMSGLII
jgi:GNAT superfamily N-acetyltransferase